MLLTTQTLVFWGLICTSLGYEQFQEFIQNGEMVPHPCKTNVVWRGVGHLNEMGAGRWDLNLCKKDSDGDGKTNGEELGDPDCVWTKGNQPSKKTGLSHPGTCDPFDNPLCNGKPDFLQYDDKEFDYPAIKEQETFNFTARLPETAVPAKETTYMCITFEFPNVESHVVAFQPIIDNEYVMHHIVVFSCKDDTTIDNTPYVCGMTPGQGCMDMIATWSFGMDGQCLHKDSGILIGGLKESRKLRYSYNFLTCV